jgi:hypothetical protein
MKPGSENRKKTIIAGALGMVALICVVYMYNVLFGGPSTPPPAAAPVVATVPTNRAAAGASNGNAGSSTLAGNAPGVAAVKMASTSSSLDPTLDEAAMLRTESLVYSGTGRNIFSATYTLPVVEIKKPIAPVRTGPVLPPPPPVPQGPPPPPPINLKFFGTAKRGAGKMQAFLLQGEDVYLAAEGDIVARKYKIVSISNNSIRVTDLQNDNTQTLPLQLN